MSVHPRLRALFDALDGSRVEWCLVRGESSLGAPAGDVDLLVSGDHLAAAEEVLFARGFAALPRRLAPGHRFYLLREPGTGRLIKIDVVTRLRFGRGPKISSGLETGVLSRRRTVDGVQRMDPTDQFWTVALHCMLDKGFVSDRRAAELSRLVREVRRPSDAETFLAETCGGPETAAAVLAAAGEQDWPRLLSYGGGALRAPAVRATGPAGRSRRPAAGLRAAALRTARPLYPALWRGSGLGSEPFVAAVVERCGVDAAVVGVRRRPLLSEVVILVQDPDIPRLAQALRHDGFRHLGGGWLRSRSGRVERVVVDAASRCLPSEAAAGQAFSTATPVNGHAHWLIPAPSTRLLLAARSMRPGGGRGDTVRTADGARGLDALRDLSDGSWREARAAAGSWGVADELTELATAVGAP